MRAHRRRRRRSIVAHSGRRYSVCDGRLLPKWIVIDDPAASNRIVALLSGVTLLLATTLSMYAVVRPPSMPAEPVARAIGAQYSFADFLRSAP